MRGRETYLGGPDIAAIAGASPYESAFDVWLSKTQPMQGKAMNAAMEWGQRLEPAIADKYRDMTGHALGKGGTLFHKDHPFIGGTPDFLSQSDPNLLLECKTAGEEQLRQHDADGRPLWGEAGTDIVPLAYQVQCQVYMGLTGRRRADLAVLFRGPCDFRIYRLAFDVELFGLLLDRAVRFWRGNVLPGVAPQLEWQSSAVTDYLCRKALDGGREIDASETPEIYDLAMSLERLSAMRRDTEEAEANTKAALLQAMAERGAKRIRGAIGGANFSIAIQGGSSGRDTVNWEAVARRLAKEAGLDAVPSDIIQAHTEPGRGRRPYLMPYFGAARKQKACANADEPKTISA